MFGFNSKSKNKTTISAKILFHKEANGRPEHGSIYADHAQFALKNEPVRFSFDGIEPPLMTPEVLAHIWDQAERQGYIVHSLRAYATVFTVVPAPVLRPRENQPTPVLSSQRAPNHQPVSRGPRRPAPERENAQAPA